MDFNFEDLGLSNAGTSNLSVSSKPPAGFSAARSASRFTENMMSMAQRQGIADYAGAGGAGVGGGVGGGGEGPSLPFRIKKVNLRPTPLGMEPVFSCARMRGADEQ
eukprot:CAMPEP_0169265758 /NCGR_PEP_ID=MMETSP1016-20121227/45961_1 /TAXON_ID=342587 /ORGANISM="Karlodinium micrum, Strain CCMP2283" /LENGTH=105 /DNA_ID=CAMNT_0009349471 /DNA_START=40 /DNA_END=357 /DNA_ORIENTATION=+